MAHELRVATDLAMPDDAVTQTFALFGKRGSGKSNTAVVLAEEMHMWPSSHSANAVTKRARSAPDQPFMSRTIGWRWLTNTWAISSPALGWSGRSPWGPPKIYTGRPGPVPSKLDFRPHQALIGSSTTNGAPAYDRVPVHVFLEEADAFIPQRPYKGEERMLGAMDRLVRWGRQEGVGSTTVTQRSAKINKDVTTQTEVLIAHRTTGPQDRDVIRDWIRYHAGGDEQQEILSTLPTLPDGTAWVWSPEWLGILRQVAFRRRETFDSAGTPKLGEQRVQPKELAPVDLDRLRNQLADTIERAKADDPSELRKRIRELEIARDHLTAENELLLEAHEPEVRIERVEVPVLNGQVDKLLEAVDRLEVFGRSLVAVGQDITAAIDRVAAPRSTVAVIPAGATPSGAGTDPPSGNLRRSIAAPRPEAESRSRARSEALGTVSDLANQGELGKAERGILVALAHYPVPLTREQLAFLADYHPRSKGFTNALGSLRSKGLITGGFPAELTPAADVAEAPPLPSSDVVIETWLARFGRAEAAILRHLIALYPEGETRAGLAAEAGYEHERSKGFTNAIGRLRGLGLVDGYALHADFARLIGR